VNDLTAREQKAVRTALPAAARRRMGAAGEGPAVRVGLDPEGRHWQARRHPSSRTAGSAVRRDRHGRGARGPVAVGPGLPHCGHPPEDFADEETIVE
jgi:hypothetical protein